jgi:hypothetical protein
MEKHTTTDSQFHCKVSVTQMTKYRLQINASFVILLHWEKLDWLITVTQFYVY